MPRASQEKPLEGEPAATGRPSLREVDRDRILEALAELSPDVGLNPKGQQAAGEALAGQGPLLAMLSTDERELVAEPKARLARLAGLRRNRPVTAAVRWALDGAEFIVSSEIVMGRASRLPKVLPGLVYLVVVPGQGRPEAMRLAKRVGRLV